WRTDDPPKGAGGPKAKLFASFTGRRGRETATWDGLIDGVPAPEGTYDISVTVEDTAGNRGSAPAVLPPLRAYSVRRSGVSVAYFTLFGTSVPVRPGSIARFVVG